MRSDLYWEERALQREEYARRASTRAIKTKTVRLYAKAQKDLDTRINRIFSRYAANGELTPEEARRMLNTKEAEAELEALRKELNNIKDPVIKRKALARLNAPAYAARINRLEALKANIETETALLADREKRELKRLLEDVSGDTYYRSIYDTQIGTGLGFEFSALPKGAVNTIVNDRWKGANFSDRIWQNTSALANSAYGIVARGIMTGAGPQVMARQLAEAMQSGMYNSMRLIRTETNRVHNAAEKAAYEEEGITEYRFLATLDGRTCDVCGALDGKTFPVSEAREGVNYPPLHPNDRCTTTAVIEGQNRAELKRRALDPETGKTVLIPAETTYEEWLAKLDNASEDGIINLYFGRKGRGVSLSPNRDIPETVAAQVEDATTRITGDFEVLERYLEPISFGDIGEALGEHRFSPSTGTNKITLNEKAFSNLETLKKCLNDDFLSGLSYQTDKIESLVAHEMGHNAHVVLALKRSGLEYGKPLTPIETAIFDEKYREITQEVYMAAFSDESFETIRNICEKELGSMAKSPRELIAQSFGNYYFGAQRQRVAIKIVKYFKRELIG